MSQLQPVRRALISVSDKSDLIPFARALHGMGIELISTGGTARALDEAGIEVRSVEDVTGFPEMMDGRVKTLHPAVHGGLLARRDVDHHVQSMSDHNIGGIDMVCINLYPFEQTILKDNITEHEAIEQIDIGGPAMIRSGAKNHGFVTVVTRPTQYDRVIDELKKNEGHTTFEMRRDLAAAAFTRTAEYDTAISAWMCSKRIDAFPTMLRLTYANDSELRYGENPHQRAAVYANPASADASIVGAEKLGGKTLSYNNINDASAALELVRDLHEQFGGMPAAAIIKHTNPCGAAISSSLKGAFADAHAGDPMAAYGGILCVSQSLDRETAEQIVDGQKFLEVVVAPGFEDGVETMLRERWKNVRLLKLHGFERSHQSKIDYRSIPGGMLTQERDLRLPKTRDWAHAAGPAPTEDMLRDAAFIWLVGKHLKSNAIAIGTGGRVLGVGTGQVDRVSACRLAIEKAEKDAAVEGMRIAASDAFFPFSDGPKLLIEAGVGCIVHPGGSIRDQDTMDLCNEHNVTCLVTGVRHFRH